MWFSAAYQKMSKLFPVFQKQQMIYYEKTVQEFVEIQT